MKKLLLTTLLIFGTAIVHGQDKMQFSIIGGYEHFKKENPHNQTAGYGLGCEFKYYFYNRLYALANFHAGIYNEFTPRTAMAEIGEVDFSMHWRTREYKGGAGMGIDLLKTQRHNIYTQATFGLPNSNSLFRSSTVIDQQWKWELKIPTYSDTPPPSQ